mgnify:CR=1 FL=1
MIGQLASAGVRAVLIATPALLLPSVESDSAQIVFIVAILAAIMTFVEYNSAYPSIVEFRSAPPFNRLRFVALFFTVFSLTAIARGKVEPTALTEMLTVIGTIVGDAIDFPYSPVRLVVLMMPADATFELLYDVRTAAGLAYLVSLLAMIGFVTMVRIFDWPARNGAFNVWVNLPLFDPTAGGDVVQRLKLDARINITLGVLLPFVMPALVKLASDLLDPISMANPLTLIWMMSAWAFLPASMIMRGIAMGKIADMIEEKRRRAYAQAEGLAHA